MNKLLMAFLIIFFVGSFMDYVINGGGGFTSDSLETACVSTDDTLYLYDTGGFPKQGIVVIGDEYIEYDNKSDIDDTLFDLNRGIYDTTAEAHDKGTRVYSEDAAAINSALGFNITNVASTGGVLAFPIIASNFIFHTLPKIVLFDFSFLNYGPLIWFRYFFMLFSIGLIFMVFYMIFTAIGSVGNTLFSFTRR